MRTFDRLSYPVLDLPLAKVTGVFRAYEKILRNDPILSATVQTFLCWSGTNMDTQEPAVSLCPYVRISPFPTSSEWVTERQHKSALTVHVEAATVGTNFDPLGNLWGAIQRCLYPQNDPLHRDEVTTLLRGPDGSWTTRATLKLAAFTGVMDGDDFLMIGRGSIEFGILEDT